MRTTGSEFNIIRMMNRTNSACIIMFADVIKSAVAAILKDGGFRLVSVPLTTTTALHTATLLVEWMNMPDNQEEVDVFARKLLTKLKSCLPQRISMKAS